MKNIQTLKFRCNNTWFMQLQDFVNMTENLLGDHRHRRKINNTWTSCMQKINVNKKVQWKCIAYVLLCINTGIVNIQSIVSFYMKEYRKRRLYVHLYTNAIKDVTKSSTVVCIGVRMAFISLWNWRQNQLCLPQIHVGLPNQKARLIGVEMMPRFDWLDRSLCWNNDVGAFNPKNYQVLGHNDWKSNLT